MCSQTFGPHLTNYEKHIVSVCICTCPTGGSGRLGFRWCKALSPAVLVWWRGGQWWDGRGLSSTRWQQGRCRVAGEHLPAQTYTCRLIMTHMLKYFMFTYSQNERHRLGVYLSRLRGITPGDSEAGAVSASVTGVVAVVTGVVAVVVSSSEELMKEVLLEAEGEVVTGVWNCCSPSNSSHSVSTKNTHIHILYDENCVLRKRVLYVI